MTQHTHLTAYALVRTPSAVLLVHKVRGPYAGLWDLPGGPIEFGEEPMMALQHELLQETGMELPGEPPLFKVLTHAGPHRLPNGLVHNIHHIGIIYRVDLAAHVPVRAAPEGHDSRDARWVPLAELGNTPLAPIAHRCLVPQT